MMDELVRKRGGVRRGSFKRKMTQTAAVMKREEMLGNRTCGDLITKRGLLPIHKDKTLNIKSTNYLGVLSKSWLSVCSFNSVLHFEAYCTALQ